MACPCCNPNPIDPCLIIVNNARKSTGEIDWYVALDIECWGGSMFPGRYKDVENGIVITDNELQLWQWYFANRQAHPWGEPGFNGQEVKAFSGYSVLLPSLGGGYTDQNGDSWFITTNPNNSGTVLDLHVKQISSTVCVLYGHVGVEYTFYPHTSENYYTNETAAMIYLYNQTWRWQSTITNGTPGGVSVSPVIGELREVLGVEQDGTLIGRVTSGTFGPTPQVTITL